MNIIASSALDAPEIKVIRPDAAGDILDGLLGVVYWGAVIVCLIAFTVGAIMLGMEFMGRRDKARSARWMVVAGAFGAFLIGLGVPFMNDLLTGAKSEADLGGGSVAAPLPAPEDSTLWDLPAVPGQYLVLNIDAGGGAYWAGPTWVEPPKDAEQRQFACSRPISECRWMNPGDPSDAVIGWSSTLGDVNASNHGVLLGALTWPVCAADAQRCEWSKASFDTPHNLQPEVQEYGCRALYGAGGAVGSSSCGWYDEGTSNTELPELPPLDDLDYGATTWLECGGTAGCTWAPPQLGQPPSEGLLAHTYWCTGAAREGSECFWSPLAPRERTTPGTLAA